MKKHLQSILSFVLFVLIMLFCMNGIRNTYENTINPPTRITVVSKNETPMETTGGRQLKAPAEAVEFISGPLVADTGQLCVFRLNDPDTRADWVIVPEAACYIDSSGASLAFASNVPAKYTIIAAVVEDEIPKILTHVCEYGLQPAPNPSPNPSPNPDPTPTPGPNPQPQNLSDWVSQNIPDAGRGQCAALADCYESAALGIENGAIRSQEAAFSAIRTATQTKIDINTWAEFLDLLSEKITEKLDGDTGVKKLGTIFIEIASGLKTVFDMGNEAEPEGNVAVPSQSPSASINPAPVGRLSPYQGQRPTEAGHQNGAEASDCDPTASWCQPQPQLRRRAR